MKKLYVTITLLLLVFLIPATGLAAETYPSPAEGSYASDFANILRDDTEQRIIALGKQLEQKTGAQVVLVTIDTLNGQDIDSYGNELFSRWKIGQKDKDNGVLILFALKERLLRIEVGYGLEGAIPDIKTDEIRRNEIAPYTKAGDFDTGFYNGYAAIAALAAGEYGVELDGQDIPQRDYSGRDYSTGRQVRDRTFNFAPFVIILLVILDGIFFRFRITSTLIRIAFWSSMFRGGRGGRGGWGGGGGFGGGGGGFSGGGGRSGGGGSSGSA